MASQTFGILVLSYVLMTIWWVLVGGRLGEAGDEDDEDSSTGSGRGSGKGVCEEGGSGEGEELMVGPAGEDGTGTMEGNRDMEMGISGEGVRAGGERGQRGLERKGGFIKYNIPRDVNTTRGHMQTLITLIRSRVI